jgi:DNA-binding XRE family transcriptional regulator
MAQMRRIPLSEIIAEVEKTAGPEYFAADERLAPYVDFEVERLALATQIREARKAKGMTQRDLADASGVQQREIVRLEKAAGNPTMWTSIRIKRALGISN